VAAVLLPLPAVAEVTQSDFVIVRADDVISEDLYAVGNRVQVEGRIEGDLYVAAFGEIAISGEVTGDVVAIASRVEITGMVGGSVRAAAATVVISGTVGEDVAMAAWNVGVESVANIGRDVLVVGRNTTIAGSIERDLRGSSSRLELTGATAGTIEFTVGRLELAPGAEVGGDLVYRSGTEATIDEAAVGGSVLHRLPTPPNIRIRALRLLTAALGLLVLTAAGLVLAATFPEFLESTINVARRGLRTWLGGIGVAASPLLGAGVLAVLVWLSPPQAGIPLVAVFLPVVLGLAGVVLLGCLLGLIPAAAAVGRRLLPKRSVAAAVLVGMILLALVLAIPWLNLVVLAAIVPLGLGALVLRRPVAPR
jgi:hypothetical protein